VTFALVPLLLLLSNAPWSPLDLYLLYGLLLNTVSGNMPPSNQFVWLAFAGTLNLLTRVTIIIRTIITTVITQLYIIVIVCIDIILHHRHVRQLLLLLLLLCLPIGGVLYTNCQ